MTALPTWPQARLAEALVLLGTRAGYRPKTDDVPTGDSDLAPETLERWLDTVAANAGLETEAVTVTVAGIDALLRGAAPALLRVQQGTETRFLAVESARRGTLSVLAPDLGVRRASADEVRHAILAPWYGRSESGLDSMLASTETPATRREQVAQAMVRERLAGKPLAAGFLVRLPPSAPFLRQLRLDGLLSVLGALVATYVVQYVAVLTSWYLVGRGALSGRMDPAWLAAWVLLLGSLVPLNMIAVWLQGRFSVGVGVLLKRRMLLGALRLDPDEVRQAGSGQLLARVVEAQAVENLALGGGFGVVVGAVQMGLAALVLIVGAGGLHHAAALGVTLVVLAGFVWRFDHVYQAWTDHRLQWTNDLVERMVGQRTRLAQQPSDQWHLEEDHDLVETLRIGKRLDGAALAFTSFGARIWLIVGVAALIPSLLDPTVPIGRLAASVGGVLLAYQAIQGSTARGLSSLISAKTAWSRTGPLFHAAADTGSVGEPFASAAESAPHPDHPVLVSRDLCFRHSGRPEPTVKGVDLTIYQRDRLLLEGPSGSGKSTLAALLVGLREPSSGLLLSRGLDRHTLGDQGWRRRIVAAPQFHENFVLTETLAFNLLMGRGWPAEAHVLREAEEVCRALGLGPLLDRMPSGLNQMVGASGWQLSHGERSRLFMARALLQNADLVVLDESFAALDPANLKRALETVLDRAPALLVIAHP